MLDGDEPLPASLGPALPSTRSGRHSDRALGGASGRLLGRRFTDALAGVRDGQLTLTWPDGSATRHGTSAAGAGRDAHVVLHNLRPLRRMALGGELGFAEGYLCGDWSTDSLDDLFALIMRNEPTLGGALRGGRLARVGNALRHARNRNSRRGSRRNVAFHYDLGNDFYRLWLDPDMHYSSALFRGADESLERAQRNKLERVTELLAPAPGARVLEIGCGWGALARHLAVAARCDVSAVSLSRQQLAWARARHGAPLAGGANGPRAGRTAFLHRDYRRLAGRYDHIVSIEMFEAVGERYWRTYFERLGALLASGGTAVLQVITIEGARFGTYRTRPDFIQRYVFPGGMLPSRTHLADLADAAGFDIVADEWFGASYARTLALWRERFERASREVLAQGFDERFVRLWRYYLAYARTGFRCGSTDVGLLLLRRR